MVTELDDRRRLKHPVGIDDKLTMFQRVDIALDEKQIGATLHREEATARHVDTVTVLEMLNSRSRSSFELWKN